MLLCFNHFHIMDDFDIIPLIMQNAIIHVIAIRVSVTFEGTHFSKAALCVNLEKPEKLCVCRNH